MPSTTTKSNRSSIHSITSLRNDKEEFTHPKRRSLNSSCDACSTTNASTGSSSSSSTTQSDSFYSTTITDASGGNDMLSVNMELLDTMIVYPGGKHSVLQLSEQHRVLLVFIKWFGCPICQGVIDDLQQYLSSFLLLNIVPVVCHQEDVSKFSEYLSHTQLLHCRITKEMKKEFAVKKASLFKHAKVMPGMIKLMLQQKKKFFLPSAKEMKGMNMLSSFGMYIVHKGQVTSSYSSDILNARPDYGVFLFHLKDDHLYSSDSSPPPEEFLPTLLQLFPNMKKVFEELREFRKSTRLVEITTGTIPLTPRNLTNNTNDTAATEELSLKNVMENPTMRTFFKAFLSNQYCLEPVIFYEQVRMFRLLCQRRWSPSTPSCPSLFEQEQQIDSVSNSISSDISPNMNDMKLEECKRKADYIVDTFLRDTSMFQINTSGKLLRKLFSEMENDQNYTDETLFDEILKDVTSAMLVHQFESFTDSTYFQDMIHRVLSNKRLKD